MGKWYDYIKDTQKGIIGYEYLGYDDVIDAKYGTFGEFKRLVKANNERHMKDHKTPRFKKEFDHRGMDSPRGINTWVVARGYRGHADLTFFFFTKDDEERSVIPNSKLTRYAERYEPFLKKKK